MHHSTIEELVNWKVEGMTCSNCALTVSKYLQKEGTSNVKVNPISGDVSFEANGVDKKNLAKGIEGLGYSVVSEEYGSTTREKSFLSNHKQRFLFCLIFTLPLMLHMLNGWIHLHWLMNPWLQLALSIPVMIVGMNFFGKSAYKSVRHGVPNMNVLVTIGAGAAFIYSLAGTLLGLGESYLFYETAATIITLVFLGNYLEDASIRSTQKSLNALASSQKVMANMIAFDDQHQELIFPIENTQLRHGDLILIKSGEQVPADCKILVGSASVNESIITGESLPVEKAAKDTIIGGSLIIDGNVKAQVIAEAKDSVLSNIIDLVKRAQGEKPPMQQLADKISAIFVPVVLGIAVLTFIINYLVLHDVTVSLMRSIAVLVISCPCAMGLATPAAIAVGLGRAARNGILFRHARSLEFFKNIQQVVFDKTGTLTTGDFVISEYKILSPDISDDEFKRILYSMEKFSNHPLGKTITREWKMKQPQQWKKIEEKKGLGMFAETAAGDLYKAGSFSVGNAGDGNVEHNIYLYKNDLLIGWIDLIDEVRPEAKTVVDYLKSRGIKTWLLSGDRKSKCIDLAKNLGIDEVLAEQTPAQKLETVERLTRSAPTAMIGDGINDAPALAKATVGISISAASDIAIQTADVVLMNEGIGKIPMALGLGKHTFVTIKQNLFWAFFYNIIAIPIAAFGFLTPSVAALAMGLSDIVLAANSGRLYIKKVV